MKERLKRIARLIDLREKETQQEVASLRFAKHAESIARQEEQQARERFLIAERRRRELSSAVSEVSEYIAQEDWLETLGIRHAATIKTLRQALAEAARASARVRQARQKEKQVRLLLEKLEQDEKAAEARRQRRQEDEFAQNMILARSRRQ